MCIAGKIRAALVGQQFLNEEISLEDLQEMARRGERATASGASTNKKNLIHAMVHRHARAGDLTDFVSPEGEFVSRDGTVKKTDDPRYRRITSDIISTFKK